MSNGALVPLGRVGPDADAHLTTDAVYTLCPLAVKLQGWGGTACGLFAGGRVRNERQLLHYSTIQDTMLERAICAVQDEIESGGLR